MTLERQQAQNLAINLKLDEEEKAQYLLKYPHIAPEIVYVEMRQSEWSDIYSAGRVMEVIADHGLFLT